MTTLQEILEMVSKEIEDNEKMQSDERCTPDMKEKLLNLQGKLKIIKSDCEMAIRIENNEAAQVLEELRQNAK